MCKKSIFCESWWMTAWWAEEMTVGDQLVRPRVLSWLYLKWIRLKCCGLQSTDLVYHHLENASDWFSSCAIWWLTPQLEEEMQTTCLWFCNMPVWGGQLCSSISVRIRELEFEHTSEAMWSSLYLTRIPLEHIQVVIQPFVRPSVINVWVLPILSGGFPCLSLIG